MKSKILFILKILIAVLYFLTFLLDSIIDGKIISLVSVTNVLMGMILSILMVINLKNKEKPQKWMVGYAILMAVFIEIGIAIDNGGSILYFKNISNILRGIFNVVTLSFFLSFLLLYIKKCFRKIKNVVINNKIIDFIFHKHPFGSAFLIVLGSSLFYLIFYYPGTTCYDGVIQLSYYYNNLPFSNHHPAILSMFMGFLMDIGKIFGSDNLGLFFFIIIQVILNALVYAYVLMIMERMQTPLLFRILTLVFYAAFPMLVVNSITFYKDTLFYLVFLFMIVYIYYNFEYKSNNDNIKYVVLFILFGGLYLFRNTGFYIIIGICLIFFLYFFRKNKKEAGIFLILLCLTLGENVLYNKMLDGFRIEAISSREALSVPIQQTARYIKYNRKDISKNDEEILINLFGDLDIVGGTYNPFISDDVKLLFKKYPENQELKSYFKVWFKEFKDDPLVYIDATLENTYGYFYPNFLNYTTGEEVPGFYFIYNMKNSKVNITHNSLDKGRDVLYQIGESLTKIPGVNLFYMPAFYIWMFIGASLYLFHMKRKKELVYLGPVFLVICSAFLGPVNGHIRYIYPLIVSMPFILGVLFRKKTN